MPKLILHLGLAKTGLTTLQLRSFRRSTLIADRLNREGILREDKVLVPHPRRLARRPRVAILLPEPHLDTGGNATLVDFLIAASQRYRVQVFFLRYSKNKSDKKLLQAQIRRRAAARIRVNWLCRLLDSNLAKGVSWGAIARGEVRWTAVRFLFDARRFTARLSLRKTNLLVTSQYVTPDGVRFFRTVSGGKLVLNLAGNPEALRENFRRQQGNDSYVHSAETYSNYLRTIDQLLLQTHQHREILVDLEPCAESKSTVIKPSVYPNNLATESCGSGVSCPLFESDRKVILNVGKLGLKGQDLALAAFAKVASLNPTWDLHFVGGLDSKPSFVADLMRQAAQLGLKDRTYFWGHRHDLGHFLRCADILLLSSEYEGAPRALREAMFVGLPIVTVPIAGVIELVNEQTAFIATCRNRESLQEALTEAVSDFSLRRSKAASAKRDFNTNMSPEAYKENVLAFIEKTL